MKADLENFEPARRSTLARTSVDSVIEVFSFILPVYYYSCRVVEGCVIGPRRSALGGNNRDLLKCQRAHSGAARHKIQPVFFGCPKQLPVLHPSCNSRFCGRVDSSDARIRKFLKRGARSLHVS